MNGLALFWMISIQLTVTVITIYLLYKVLRSKKEKKGTNNSKADLN
jgi:heme/copper-type cytochrome/quinol oxidase subunit 2